MKNILWLALNHLNVLSKDRTAYLLLLALPLALTLITGMAFGGGNSSGEAIVLNLAVVDLDQSDISRYLVKSLHSETTSIHELAEDRARELVGNKEIPAAVIIPAGFQKSLKDGLPVEILVLRADLQESPRIIEQLVSRQIFQLRANAAAAQLGSNIFQDSWTDLFEKAASKWEPAPAVEVNVERLAISKESEIAMGNEQSSPGYVVMFGMMTVIVAGSTNLLQERQNGTLARLLAAPLNRFQLLMGKTLGLMASGIFQMLLMIIAGQYIFRVNWGQSFTAVFLLVAALSFAATGFGMMLASLCRTHAQAESLGILSVVVMSMLGGTWWPVEVLPSFMQFLYKLVPSGWAMQGFTDLILRGANLADVILPLLVLTGFGAAFLVVGSLVFRFEK
jgi:ABC-2 type transport system permease protein